MLAFVEQRERQHLVRASFGSHRECPAHLLVGIGTKKPLPKMSQKTFEEFYAKNIAAMLGLEITYSHKNNEGKIFSYKFFKL
jgi:hypothetical protein